MTEGTRFDLTDRRIEPALLRAVNDGWLDCAYGSATAGVDEAFTKKRGPRIDKKSEKRIELTGGYPPVWLFEAQHAYAVMRTIIA